MNGTAYIPVILRCVGRQKTYVIKTKAEVEGLGQLFNCVAQVVLQMSRSSFGSPFLIGLLSHSLLVQLCHRVNMKHGFAEEGDTVVKIWVKSPGERAADPSSLFSCMTFKKPASVVSG